MTKRFLGIAAVTAAGLVPAAESPARPQTTAPPEAIVVKITLTDTAFRVSPKSAPRGDIARFVLVNSGKKPHAFALGHLKRGIGSQTGFTKALKPNQQSILILFLDYRGELPYRGTLPQDRINPRMAGIFKIT